MGFVGGVLGLCEVDGKADARRERISAWAGTPSGDTAMVPEGGEKGGRQEGEDIGLGRDSVGGYSYGSMRWMERRTPEGEDIGPGKDSVGGYN